MKYSVLEGWAKRTAAPLSFFVPLLFSTVDEKHLAHSKSNIWISKVEEQCFKSTDFSSVLANKRPGTFFIRKIDPATDRQIIDDIESIKLIGSPKKPLANEGVAKSYWYNSPAFDPNSTFGQFVFTSVRNRLKRCGGFEGISETNTRGHIFRKFDTDQGIVLRFGVKCLQSSSWLTVEAFVNKTPDYAVRTFRQDTPEYGRKEFLGMDVTITKNETSYRNVLGLYMFAETLEFRLKWTTANKNFTATFLLIDPAGNEACNVYALIA